MPDSADLDAVATFSDPIVDEAMLAQMMDVLHGVTAGFIRFKDSVIDVADTLKSFEGSIIGTWHVETHWTKRYYKMIQRRLRRNWRRYQRQKRKQ